MGYGQCRANNASYNMIRKRNPAPGLIMLQIPVSSPDIPSRLTATIDSWVEVMDAATLMLGTASSCQRGNELITGTARNSILQSWGRGGEAMSPDIRCVLGSLSDESTF